MKEDDYDHEGCLRTLHQSFLEIQVMSGEVDGASRGGRCVGAWHSLRTTTAAAITTTTTTTTTARLCMEVDGSVVVDG